MEVRDERRFWGSWGCGARRESVRGISLRRTLLRTEVLDGESASL